MNRPPPLQLVLDNMLPNLGLRPKKPFFLRVYELNWRPVVIAITTINALRFALLASNSFQDQLVDLEEDVPHLAHISLTLGVLYFAACLMEAFGLFSSLLPRSCLVRFYVLFAFLSLVVVTAARTTAAVGYFVFADDVVRECVALASTGTMDSRSMFRSDAWHKSYNVPIPTGEAQYQCLATWHAESASEILSVIFFTLVPSTISFIVAWTWGRQARDPTHTAYLGATRCQTCCCCCGGESGQRPHGGRSAIHIEEYSPIHADDDMTPRTAHSHHITTQLQARQQLRPSGLPIGPNGRRGPPPPLMLGVPPAMRQHVRPPVSVSENFQTMAPLDLNSASPYGVTPGPPSYAPADYSYTYDYAAGGLDTGNRVAHQPEREPPQQQRQQQAVPPVRRGRGEYWFV
jgi:hypothetical protein